MFSHFVISISLLPYFRLASPEEGCSLIYFLYFFYFFLAWFLFLQMLIFVFFFYFSFSSLFPFLSFLTFALLYLEEGALTYFISDVFIIFLILFPSFPSPSPFLLLLSSTLAHVNEGTLAHHRYKVNKVEVIMYCVLFASSTLRLLPFLTSWWTWTSLWASHTRNGRGGRAVLCVVLALAWPGNIIFVYLISLRTRWLITERGRAGKCVTNFCFPSARLRQKYVTLKASRAS